MRASRDTDTRFGEADSDASFEGDGYGLRGG